MSNAIEATAVKTGLQPPTEIKPAAAPIVFSGHSLHVLLMKSLLRASRDLQDADGRQQVCKQSLSDAVHMWQPITSF